MAVGNGASRVTMKESKMKTLKCPSCGNEMQLQSDVYDEDLYTGNYTRMYYYECINCPLATTPADTAKDAENQIKELISKFPPIMRVWPEDTVVWKNTPVTILDKDVQYGELLVINSQGRKFLIPHHAVEKWPWELKRQEQP